MVDNMNISETFWDFKGQGEYTDKKFMMSTPFPVLSIVLFYLWFVLRSGPEFMKHRKPFQINNVLCAYNLIQVAVSCYIFQLGAQFMYKNGVLTSTCLCESKEVQHFILDGGHYYFLTKMVELLDTVFFVLRKRYRQVTFLHVYHHALMVLATWTVVKYNKTDSTIFIGTINSLIHIVMYSYYALSVFPELTKYLWWKKYITIMQLIQFTLMFLHIVISHAISECKPAYIVLFATSINTVLFMYLFGDFYIKSYVKKINKEVTNQLTSQNNINNFKIASKLS